MVKFYLDDYNLIKASSEIVLNDSLRLFVDGKESNILLREDSNFLYLTTDFDANKEYKVFYNGEYYDLTPRFIVHSERFEKEYHVDLNTLGCFVYDNYTLFKVWSPLAKLVEVFIDGKPYKMNYENSGVFSIRIEENLDGHYYHYLINSNKERSFKDPFAYIDKDENDAYIVDKRKLVYEKIEMRSYRKPIIYEVSVRDFSSDSSVPFKYPKKFLGLTEDLYLDGKPVGFNYLKTLGITHVQLMPIFSFDLDKADYNWGYNPLSYNSLHKDYLVNEDPYIAINELRSVVNKFHENNIRVTFDVVYNHVYNYKRFNLDRMLPYYFFRYKDGIIGNASYCGNEIRSEAYFTREYLKLLVRRFIEIYDVDGYRFDLMGILDIDTILAIKQEAQTLKKDFILYGEGWNMGDILHFENKCIKENAYKLPDIGFFNDIFRNVLRGWNIEEGRAYLIGDVSLKDEVKNLLMGSTVYGLNDRTSINYIECHDNYAFYDKLEKLGFDEEKIIKIVKLGLSLVLLSKGVPFINSGQEFLRSKKGVDNSYNSGDEINKLDWHRKNKYEAVTNYFRDLINLKNRLNEFYYDCKAEFIDYYEVLIYKMGNLTIFINPCGYDHVYNDGNTYQVVFDETGFKDFETGALKINSFSVLVTYKNI